MLPQRSRPQHQCPTLAKPCPTWSGIRPASVQTCCCQRHGALHLKAGGRSHAALSTHQRRVHWQAGEKREHPPAAAHLQQLRAGGPQTAYLQQLRADA
eukprot:3031543-Alexandrium_andersonii.AAC.1